MLLQYLIENLENSEITGDTDIEINKIEYDSKKVKSGDVFVAIKGFVDDGINYIDDAIKSGAIAIVTSKNEDISKYICNNITFIRVENTRKALAIIASVYYDNPSSKLNMIGITGTKGKTTTAFMLRDILLASKKKVGMIGTIYNTYNDVKIEASRTSPESLDLQKLLFDMVNAGIEYVVMEVSSHALELYRVYGIIFKVGIFTNLAPEHLDFHGTMENYLNAKAKLFSQSEYAIINGDDIYAKKLIKTIKTKYATFGLDNDVNITATDVRVNSSYVEFKMYVNKMLETIHVEIPGKFSVYNALAAIAAASFLNCQMDAILLALANVKVPGRCETVSIGKTFSVVIDYAHNPSSMEAILTSLKKFVKGRIICVFGCGGNRDTSKREKMGELAGRYADFTVITTDNPRDESPKSIISQIEMGIKQTKGLYKVEENRIEAIKFAMRIAWKNDIVLLLGKGHETYMELKGGKKIHFDEREIVRKIADEMPNKNIEQL